MAPKKAGADWIKQELSLDDKVKVAGFDVDGILRGEIKKKKSSIYIDLL